jgi:lysozyme
MSADGRHYPASLWLSDHGAKLIAEREGCELTTYLDSRGILTIGIGHTSACGPPFVSEGMTITQDRAHKIFKEDNQRFRQECLSSIKAPLLQFEFDALCSFVFNVGTTQFLRSTLLKRLNAKDYAGAAEAMLWWSKPAEIISRRRGEYYQFLGKQFVARA